MIIFEVTTISRNKSYHPLMGGQAEPIFHLLQHVRLPGINALENPIRVELKGSSLSKVHRHLEHFSAAKSERMPQSGSVDEKRRHP